ncbi:MAG TPA: excinuclease ABC subunit UvrB [Patescibacteria group bacterium]|nr:excinuclease ABC subunit UvrB [Patescibacteria group bacterium]
MNKFSLKSAYTPIPDQQKAIDKLCQNINNKIDRQVLLGVTGSGKTFTAANVINKLSMPALVISHNKTLAAQLYQEFRDFFPENAVSYFVSYYDYYQPEAYIPSTDTYIEKDADINETIDKLRLAATTNILTRPDTIVVASVSCIYNIGSPKQYGKFIFETGKNMKIQRKQMIDRLTDLQYERSDFSFKRGTFRVRGNILDVYPAYSDIGIRFDCDETRIKNISQINTVTGEVIEKDMSNFVLYPAKHYITDPSENENAFEKIDEDLKKHIKYLESQGKIVEAQRISQRVNYDMSMIKEVGYVKGIENYSRYFDGRNPGDAPYTLLDYFQEKHGNNWLLFIDESHMTFPQIRGMYNGDQARKNTLIDYGFRLPSALDNRPLRFEEFLRSINGFIAMSATPSEWELSQAYEAGGCKKQSIDCTSIVQQLVRPTGIPDPLTEIRSVGHQVKDVIKEIKKETKKGRRTLVTTLTKKIAEDLTTFLHEQNIKVQYIHSDVDTLERTDILDNLRRGNFDCIIGVNLLREGLDLPEVALVAILDADKEGFLRSEVSLIQTMGRAARHVEGRVILYADKITGSIKRALAEVERRRNIQLEYNKTNNITPISITKPFRERIIEYDDETDIEKLNEDKYSKYRTLPDIDFEALTPYDKRKLAKKLRTEMKIAARELNFELAIEIRDMVKKIDS